MYKNYHVSCTVICKIYDFEHVMHAHMQFVYVWHIEIVFNSSKKALHCGILIFWLGGKICIVKIEKWIIFPKSWNVNSNPDVYILS